MRKEKSKMSPKEIEKNNTDEISKVFEKIKGEDLEKYFTDNIFSYLSDALRINQYYGNLRIKYIGFNFTFIAFFGSILALYMSLTVSLDFSLWYTAMPIIIGLIIYFTIFMKLLRNDEDTVSFNYSDLQHYNCAMKREDYPNITSKNLEKFMKLIKKEKAELIKDNLKTLILHYFYQLNYNKVGLKMKKCLKRGGILLISSLLITFFINIILWIISLIPIST